MPKNLVVCADGTWNRPEMGRETNVVKLYRALLNDREGGQLAFYDEGVGNGLFKLSGGAFGTGISRNIRDCYRFLVDEYEPGDRIYLFGFSRGAYTVRSLGGMLSLVGLLPRSERDRIGEAYNMYRVWPTQPARVNRFKDAHHGEEVKITMIGVWDTVGALGIPLNWINQFNPVPHRFHDLKLGRNVENAYHAMAIDEKRQAFEPTLWQEPPVHAGQTIEQVWFSGVHSDVGGGYGADECGLSDIALLWMAERARRHGVLFDARDLLKEVDGSRFWDRMHDSWKFIFKLARKKDRVLPAGAKLHTSVRSRLAGEPRCVPNPYEPPNVPKPYNVHLFTD